MGRTKRISPKCVYRNKTLSIALSFALLSIGIFYIHTIWTKYTTQMVQRTIALTETAKSFFAFGDVDQLDGDASDLDKQAYVSVKEILIRIKANSDGVHAAYLIGQKDGNPIFLVDSQAAATDGYAPPGQVYTQWVVQAEQVFSTGQPATTKIGQGAWVSALTPITDAQTGETLAVFGMDFPAAPLASEINRHVFHAVAMVAGVLVVLFALYSLSKKNSALHHLSDQLAQRETLFRTVFEQAPVGIAIGHDKMLISDINPMFEMILNRTQKELSEVGWPEYTHPDDLQADLDNFNRMRAGDTNGYAMEKRFIRPDGSVAWVNMNVVPLRLADDKYPSFNHLCIIQDITKRKQAEAALNESERSKSVLLSHLPGMAYRCRFDKDWTMDFVSQGCVAMTGYTPCDLLHKNDLTYYDLILPQYREALWREWLRVLALKASFRYEYEIKTANGQHKWVLELGQGIYDQQNNVSALEGIVIDITEQKAHEAQIHHLHIHDPLTGLHNRVYLDQEIARLDRLSNLPITHLVADINGVRLINDAFGHLEGDRLIQTVADILKRCARPGDVLARMAGDTFVMFMPHAGSATAHAMRLSIEKACTVYNRTSDKTYDVDLSIGYATKQSPEQSMQKVGTEAEIFMHNRKLLNRRSSYSAIVSSIMATVFEKSQETEEHALRIADLCQTIGERLSLPDKSLGELRLFAMLHDIGKIAVHDEILNKKDPLTPAEWAVLKKHPETGYRIAMSTPDFVPIAEYILYHHEHWDGKGYPQGLSGERIPLLSRILAVADAFDAMTGERSYRKSISKQAAIAEIVRNSGTQFDPHVVNIFVQILQPADGELDREVKAQ